MNKKNNNNNKKKKNNKKNNKKKNKKKKKKNKKNAKKTQKNNKKKNKKKNNKNTNFFSVLLKSTSQDPNLTRSDKMQLKFCKVNMKCFALLTQLLYMSKSYKHICSIQ